MMVVVEKKDSRRNEWSMMVRRERNTRNLEKHNENQGLDDDRFDLVALLEDMKRYLTKWMFDNVRDSECKLCIEESILEWAFSFDCVD